VSVAVDVVRIVTGAIRENCWLVVGGDGGAIVIDPGESVDEIEAELAARAASPLAILNTHGHFDHVGAVDALVRRHGIPFHMSSDDARILRSANMYRFMFGDRTKVALPTVTHDLKGGPARLTYGGIDVECIPTPGHTPGGFSFLIGRHLFSGDTLLRGRIGPVDLPGSDADVLAVTLGHLASLPPDTIIHAGHGSDSTIGAELAGNDEFRAAAERAEVDG
jgi:hydroxyacylglutathione hydrolase